MQKQHMTGYFQIAEFRFFPQKNEIHRGENILKIRPKTADLLTALLNADGGIVSKGDLLASVWSDVAAEEYVVFQSIVELRKIFDDARVIKTHPRKGYSIAVDIHKCEEQAGSTSIPQSRQPDTANPNESATDKKRVPLKAILFGLAALVLLLIAIVGVEFNDQEAIPDSGSIVVLPVVNRIDAAEHMWVRYGGMDLLIKYLQPQVNAQVLPTEMVLDTMTRAEVQGEDIDETAIKRLFEVTGAQLIVTQAISGFSGEFQLVYGLYESDDVTRGVLFADDIESLFLQLNALVLQSMGATQQPVAHSYQHNFSNALMAKAIDETQLGNNEQAITMYKAVLVAEPHNVLAIKMLVKSLVLVGKYVEAESVAADAVKHVMQDGDNKNLGRLFFWQAVSITQQGKYDEALSILHYAKAKSEHTGDLLYQANVSRIAGKLYLQKKQYNMVRLEIDKALSLYKSINEPYGQASMYIDLGELELALNDTNKAKAAFEQAHELATHSRLTQLVAMSSQWLAKIDDPQR